MLKPPMPLSQPLPATLLKPEWPSPHLNLAIYPPTVWTLHPLTLPPPPSSATPAWRQVACQWQKEQLLEARKKWEAQWRSWCSSTSEGRRETALSAVRIHKEASVPFAAPTPKHAQLMGTVTLNVGRCSMSVSAPPPPSSLPRPTSSVNYPPPWRELIGKVKSPTPATQPHRPWKRRRPEDKEWRELREDRCEVHKGEGRGRCKGKGDC